MTKRKIILASQSPRRRVLLTQIGLKFDICESEYEEDMRAKDDPYELAKFLALNKALDVARHYEDAIVIGADTFAVFGGEFIGKPRDEQHAREILKNFSGKKHEIITGLAIIDTKNKITISDMGTAFVKFRNLSDKEIDNYILTGEPMTRGGAYGLMEKAAVLIEGIEGDFYSVIGLPLNKVYMHLVKLGVDALIV